MRKQPTSTAKLAALSLLGLTVAGVLSYPSIRLALSAPSAQTTQVPNVGQDHPAIPDTKQHPVIEAVFVLDTTGSMSGLIRAAKDKIWSIASTMASAEPAPEIRIGLVAYRDRGDDYVTRVVGLTPDLDAIHAELMQFHADGGGDGPESVNQAIYDAVHGIDWSQDDGVYQVIFLVGDAPAHMDYDNDVPYPQTLTLAQEQGIRVNAIQCGRQTDTKTQWQTIAQLGNGSFFQVEQGGSAVAVTTPYDAELARLSEKLDDTRLYYGKAEARQAHRAKLAAEKEAKAAASPAAMARRAGFVTSASGKASLLGKQEMVDEVASGRLDVADLPAEELPEPLVGLNADEQRAVIAEKAKERDALSAQIQTLSQERAEYLQSKVAESGAAEASLDHKIYRAVREQAADKGLFYGSSAPAY